MSSRTEDVLLMIADISGYTRFMVANQTELEHSHQIVGALLEAIIEEVEIPLEVAKLEGDAVFLYLVKADDRDAALSRARAKLMRFFAAFQSTLAELAAATRCACGACIHIDALRLKVVAHSGTALIYTIASRTELAGVDVIILHRLLKNSIPFDEYILLTETAARDLELDLPVLATATEDYEALGKVGVAAYRPVVEAPAGSPAEP